MSNADRYDQLFIIAAFGLQVVLVIYFTFRKWAYKYAIKYGWIVYAFSIPALIISIILWRAGTPWFYWMGGILYAVWGLFGTFVDTVRQIPWRTPPYWPVLIPYVLLFLSSQMFYWWPVGMLSRPLWYVYAVLFLISTSLNLTSHA